MNNKPVISRANNRMSLEKAKKKRRKRKMKNRLLAFAVIMVCIFFVCFAVYDKVFVIKQIEIKGDEVSKEIAEEMAKSIGITKGINIFEFNKKDAEQSAVYSLSQYENVKVEYSLPDKIVIKVEKLPPSMYMLVDNEVFTLSDDLKILSRLEDASVAETMALKLVKISGVENCIAGKYLTAEDDSDERLKELIKVFKEENLFSDVDEIDITSRFDIRFTYKKRFEVKLGTSENLTVKVRFMKSIADKLKDTDSGYIDVSDDDLREGTFKPF